jgi:hypothetical protein
MKFAILSAIALLAAGAAHADSFTIIQNGKEYTCTPSTAENPGGAIECAEKAYAGPFSKDESTRLCQGASGVGPAECALKAYAGPFSKDESIELCIRTGTVANADCAIRAYAGPYSKDEAIQLCKVGAPALMLKALSATSVSERKLQDFKDRSVVDQMFNLSDLFKFQR